MREELEQCCKERQDCVEMKQHKPDPPREMEMILRPLLLVTHYWLPLDTPKSRDWKRLGSAQLKSDMKKSLLGRAVNWLQMQGRELLEKHIETGRGNPVWGT